MRDPNENFEIGTLEDEIDDKPEPDGLSRIATNNGRNARYAGVDNLQSDDEYIPTSRHPNRSRAWIRALVLFSFALVVDCIVLTIFVFRENAARRVAAWAPLPAPSQVITSLAFGSCADQTYPQNYWDTLALYKPDITVLMGDNVYGDCKNETCVTLQQAYKDMDAHPSFQGVKSLLPITATLDDHDYGLSDCHADNVHKDLAKQLFLEFFAIPQNDERRNRNGVYKSYAWGKGDQVVQLLLLDTRYSRSAFVPTDEPRAPKKELYMPDYDDTSKQMLSPEQWTWLRKELDKPANVRIVISSIQVLSQGHGYECWRMLPYELDKLKQMLLNVKDSVNFLISGDRHVGGIYQDENGIVEMTASSWTHTIPLGGYDDCDSIETCDEDDDVRIGNLVRVNNFGSIELDWEARQVKLAMRRAEMSQEYRFQRSHDDPRTDAAAILMEQTYSIP